MVFQSAMWELPIHKIEPTGGGGSLSLFETRDSHFIWSAEGAGALQRGIGSLRPPKRQSKASRWDDRAGFICDTMGILLVVVAFKNSWEPPFWIAI